MVDAGRTAVDVHPLRMDDSGDGRLPLLDGSEALLSAAGLGGSGTIGGRRLRCLTAEQQMVAHSGYEPVRPRDRHDLNLIAGLLG